MALQKERWAIKELRRRLQVEGHKISLLSWAAEIQLEQGEFRTSIRELTGIVLSDLYPGGPWHHEAKERTEREADPAKIKKDYEAAFGSLDSAANVAELEKLNLALKPKGQNRLLG